MMRYAAKNLMAIVFCVMFAGQAFAEEYMPMLIKVLVQADKAVSEEHFEGIKGMLTALDERLVLRAASHPLKRPDHLSITLFGDAKRQYTDMKFVDCSDLADMTLLYKALDATQHPKYPAAAIYEALVRGTRETLETDSTFPGFYLKVIVLVVQDGADAVSLAQYRESVKDFFPQEDIYLTVVGIDHDAKLDEFQEFADHLGKIEWRSYVNYEDYF